jgi:RNA polymerase sigma factor (sigma-70 family)
MPTRHISQIVQQLRKAVLLQDVDRLSDGQLLGRFLEGRDQAACAALVRRHGPMVWGVCRRLLNHHDAEDAFQATFLVLVRRAASVRPREMVANWLHGVAHQTALKARSMLAKRRAREKQVMEMPQPQAADPGLWNDLQPLLDEELRRLPDKYRAIIVLCDLEAKPRREVARQLGWSEGTVASRLARARMMLAKRLARRGVTVSTGALATVLSEKAASACVPASAVSSTIKAVTLVAAGQAAAAGLISANVAALIKGVMQGMLLNKLKMAASALLVVAAAGLGAGGVLYATQGADPVAKGDDRAEAPREQIPATPKVTQNDSKPPSPTKEAPTVPEIPPLDGSLKDPSPPPLPLSPADQIRRRYLELQDELSRHLSPDQVANRVGLLEKEVAAAKERTARMLKEQNAAAELQKIKVALRKIAETYADTEAGKKAQRAYDAIDPNRGYVPVRDYPAKQDKK